MEGVGCGVIEDVVGGGAAFEVSAFDEGGAAAQGAEVARGGGDVVGGGDGAAEEGGGFGEVRGDDGGVRNQVST